MKTMKEKMSDLFESKRNRHIVVFGENHWKFDEVQRIRNEIIKFKPDVILHELWWDEVDFFKKSLPDVPLQKLENQVGKFKNIEAQFKSRETSMIKHIKQAIRNFDRIAIVIGDTHLRTIATEELGKKSPVMTFLRSVNADVYRSRYSEIK